MATSPNEIERLKLRINELERRVRMQKRGGFITLFVLTCIILCGADKVIDRLTVEDRNGRIRADIHVNPNNGRASGLSLFDGDGKIRIDMGVNDQGLTVLRLFDRNGNVRDLGN